MSSSLNAAGLAFLSMVKPSQEENKELNQRKEALKKFDVSFSCSIVKIIAKDKCLNATCIRCDKTVVLGTRCCGQYAMFKK